MAAQRPGVPVVAGFIELVEPDLDTAVDRLVDRGVTGVTAVPLVLLGARHATVDVPAALARAQRRHGAVAFASAGEIGTGPVLEAVLRDRVAGAVGATGVPPDAVVLAARGSSDPAANDQLRRLAGRLTGDRDLGLVVAAFVSLADPDLPAALEECRRAGAGRIVVTPYLLFHGLMEARLRELSAGWAADNPGTTVLTAARLGADARLVAQAWQRYDQAESTA